jgi:hypothetical protein
MEDHDIITVNTDKGLGIGRIEYDQYVIDAFENHFNDTATYECISSAEAEAEAINITSCINEWLVLYGDVIGQSKVDYIASHLDKCRHPFPFFYQLYKIHKKPLKTRPVISGCGSLLHPLGHWIDEQLQPVARSMPSYFRSSYVLKEELLALRLPPNAVLFTADATSMYTNIDTDTALEAFSFLFEHYNEEIPSDFPKALFLSVLEIVMKRNLFQFDDTYWLQKDGTAMGTPTACLHATISYGVHERNRILPTYKDFLLLYKRFIDDVFGIWIPHDNGLDDLAWSEFKNTMNEWRKLRWIVSDRTTSVDFLDLNLTINNGRILTRTFQKSMNLYLYIPPISAHPTSCFKGLIVGNFLRFRKQNNDENFCILLRNFAHHLLARGHSLKAIRKHFRNAANLTDN